ncbi:hypothetical protein IWZ03DRAFT_171700 [Phyllosticta citriasiana]|uniref:Uncharacterized protein n=1 Tax=Phyllosticta citriasiana TaxID=595635 RepID=A0ABR1KM73_9PEZI
MPKSPLPSTAQLITLDDQNKPLLLRRHVITPLDQLPILLFALLEPQHNQPAHTQLFLLNDEPPHLLGPGTRIKEVFRAPAKLVNKGLQFGNSRAAELVPLRRRFSLLLAPSQPRWGLLLFGHAQPEGQKQRLRVVLVERGHGRSRARDGAARWHRYRCCFEHADVGLFCETGAAGGFVAGECQRDVVALVLEAVDWAAAVGPANLLRAVVCHVARTVLAGACVSGGGGGLDRAAH